MLQDLTHSFTAGLIGIARVLLVGDRSHPHLEHVDKEP
jgi:hypothetical protein